MKKYSDEVIERVEKMIKEDFPNWAIRERFGIGNLKILEIKDRLGLRKRRRSNAIGRSSSQKKTVINRSGAESPNWADSINQKS